MPLFKRKVQGCYAEDVAALEYLLLDADAVDEGAVCRAAVFDLPAGSGFADSAVITGNITAARKFGPDSSRAAERTFLQNQASAFAYKRRRNNPPARNARTAGNTPGDP